MDVLDINGHKAVILGQHKFKKANDVIVLDLTQMKIAVGNDFDQIVILPAKTSAKRIIIGVIPKEDLKAIEVPPPQPKIARVESKILGPDGKALA